MSNKTVSLDTIEELIKQLRSEMEQVIAEDKRDAEDLEDTDNAWNEGWAGGMSNAIGFFTANVERIRKDV